MKGSLNFWKQMTAYKFSLFFFPPNVNLFILYWGIEGDQSWVFTGRTDAEAETPILWPPHVKS